MKKFLLRTALAVSGLMLAGNAFAVEYLSQEGWTISGCSEELTAEGDTNGRLTCLIDGDFDTFYHSAYSNGGVPSTCTKTGHYHWFVIDLGSSQTFYGLDYWRRNYSQATVNGQAYAGKIYVSETAFTAFATHDEAKTYFDNSENVAAGTFSFEYSSDPNGAKSCYFDDATTGRYVLVIVSNSQGGYLSGGEVKLHKDIDPTGRFNQAVAGQKEIAEGMSLIADIVGVTATLPSTDVPSGISVDNWEAMAEEVKASLTTYIRAFDRKQITIQNVRRSGTPYLTAVVMGNGVKFNTETEFTPDAVWAICSVDNGFKLYNRNTGYYIGSNMGPNVNNSGAQVFFPAAHGDDGDFAIKVIGSSNGLNIDNQGNNLTSYGATDGGSSWLIKSGEYSYDTPEVSTAESRKYYRLVNARWMYNLSSPCLGANGENQTGSGNGEEPSYAKAAIPGMYWRVESVGEGDAVKLVNLTGYELTYTSVSQDGNNAKLTNAGSELYFLEQTANQFAGISGGYAICSQATADSRNCLDANATSGKVKIDWNPTSESAGHNNNGSLWYFILATEDEVATAKATYIDAVASRCEAYEYLAETFGDEFFEEVFGTQVLTEITDVAAVNEYILKIRNAQPGLNEAVMTEFAENKNTTYMFKTVQSYSNCYMYEGVSNGNPVAGAQAVANDLNNFWVFDAQEDGGFKVRNAYTDKCVGMTDDSDPYGFLPMNDKENGSVFTVDYNAEVGGFSFVVSGKGVSELYAIHHAGGTRIARWNAETGTRASFWCLIALDECPVDLQQSSASGHVMTFSGMSVNTHESAADLTIKVTKRAEESEDTEDAEVVTMSLEPDADGVYTISAADITDGEVSLSGLSEGIYDVEVPAGMFIDSEGMPVGAYSNSFSVAADGTTTGIEAVGFVAPVKQGIYDLQGRRLSAPVKGINIINGKKVLVK